MTGICLVELRRLLDETCQIQPIPSDLLDSLSHFTESGGWEALTSFFDTQTLVSRLEIRYENVEHFADYINFVRLWMTDGNHSSLEVTASHVRHSSLDKRSDSESSLNLLDRFCARQHVPIPRPGEGSASSLSQKPGYALAACLTFKHLMHSPHGTTIHLKPTI